jgi:hypothetical protein
MVTGIIKSHILNARRARSSPYGATRPWVATPRLNRRLTRATIFSMRNFIFFIFVCTLAQWVPWPYSWFSTHNHSPSLEALMSDEIKDMLESTRKELVFKLVRIGSKIMIDGLRTEDLRLTGSGMSILSLGTKLAKALAEAGAISFGTETELIAILKAQADLSLDETYTVDTIKAEMDWVSNNIDLALDGLGIASTNPF